MIRGDAEDASTLLRPRVENEVVLDALALHVVAGPERGVQFAIGASHPARVLCGKGPACELRLTDPHVSRRMPLSPPLSTKNYLQAIAFGPNGSHRIYALYGTSMYSAHLARSDNDGALWTGFNQNGTSLTASPITWRQGESSVPSTAWPSTP